MGGTAFVLLIAVEVALSLVLGGRLTEVPVNSADGGLPPSASPRRRQPVRFP